MPAALGGKVRVFLLAMAAMALGTLSCDDDAPTAPNLTYPTTYAPLSSHDLGLLIARFESENPGNCTTLDAYGFTKISSVCNRDAGPVTCSNSDQLIERAKADVARNHRFTGVLHAEELRVRRYTCRDSLYFPSIHIRFENQLWDGLEVLGTDMLVHMNDAGVWSMYGHHYPVIFVPTPGVSSEAAEDSLVGKTLTTGWPTSYDYIVKEDSFVGDPLRVVYPYIIENRIELRVTWSINVVNTWMVYVDTITGEQIAVSDLVYY
jgi:hypothetical protein